MAQITPLGALTRGAIAGAVGTLAMDYVWYRRYQRGGGEESFTEWEFSQNTDGFDSAGAPAQVGKRIVEGLFDTKLEPEKAGTVNNVVHWLTGIQWGLLHGALIGSARKPSLSSGLLTGSIAFSAAYTILGAAGVYKPLWEYDWETLGKDYSAHLVYGLATALAFRTLTLGRAGSVRANSSDSNGS